jgi:hypothetical protein
MRSALVSGSLLLLLSCYHGRSNGAIELGPTAAAFHGAAATCHGAAATPSVVLFVGFWMWLLVVEWSHSNTFSLFHGIISCQALTSAMGSCLHSGALYTS